MSQLRVFSLVGDSNVSRHMNPTNRRDRPAMEAAEVLPCTRVEAFRTTLCSVREESTVCIVSCITNFLTSSSSSDTLSLRVDPVFKDFFSTIVSECERFPSRKYLVCPPMYRRAPLWYRDGLPEILTRFSSSYQVLSASNLLLLPSFATPAYESDGVHLNAYSGLEFVLHLFDSANQLLTNLASTPEIRASKTLEANRSLGDRVVALEQGLTRLNSGFELKTAVDAELSDYRANERLEDSFVVTGLQRLPSGLTGKAWQERAQSDVRKMLSKLLPGNGFKIIVVHNITGRSPGSEVSYTVKLDSSTDSQAIRAKFGSFFAGGQDRRPQEFKNVGVSNCVTRETRVRIAILKLFGQRYVDSNPGAKMQVIGYQPRPLLKLTPPPDSGDKKVKTFNFIEAVQRLPCNFSEEEVLPLLKRYGGRYPGRLRSLFVVLSDDNVPHPPASRGKRARSPSASAQERVRPRIDDM